jgi:hypothetical protein
MVRLEAADLLVRIACKAAQKLCTAKECLKIDQACVASFPCAAM